MATYKHLRSGTANKRPTTSIADGQLAINTNTASPGLFFKDSTGTGIVKVGPVHVGTTAPNSVPAAGGSSGNYLGEQWLDTSVSPAQMKVWNGSTWVGVVADELPVSKLQDGAARQLIQTDAAGTGVEWTSNVDVPGTLDVTSTATFDSIAQYPLGSAGAPTITFTGDNNTGIYSPGADQLAISTAGSGRLFVDASGNVGLGITPVANTLIGGARGSSLPGLIELAGNGNTVGSSGFAIGQDGSGVATLFQRANAAMYFATNGTERLRITSAGLVGVGTSAPQAELNVAKTGGASTVYIESDAGNNATTSILRFGGASGRSASIQGFRGASSNIHSLDFYTYNSADVFGMRLTPTGLGVGTTSVASILHTSGSSDQAVTIQTTTAGADTRINFRNSAGTDAGGIQYLHNGNHLLFNTNSGERVRIDGSGRVGIGSSSPVAALTVVGSAGAGDAGIQITSGSSNVGSKAALFFVPSTSPSFSTGSAIKSERLSPDGCDLQFFTVSSLGNTPVRAMTIDSSQRVGIGTTSPIAPLQIFNASDALVDITNPGTGLSRTRYQTSSAYFHTGINDGAGSGFAGAGAYSAIVWNSASTPLVFATSNTQRAQIDSSGRLLLGTSSTSADTRAIIQGRSSAGDSTGRLHISSGNNTPGDGDGIAELYFTSSGHVASGRIAAQRDGGTWTAGSSLPTRLVFSTTADGASSPTERMRITNSGYLKASNSGSYYAVTNPYHEFLGAGANDLVTHFENTTATGPYGIRIRFSGASPNNSTNYFLQCVDSSTTIRTEIRSNGGLANFQANNVNLSDRNAKKDITPAANTWDCIKEWEIVNYRYKDQPDDADLNLGVIAQQVAESCPEVITVFQEAKEATEDQPAQEERLGVKEQQMYWMAIKTLQEAQVRIEALEAEVAALKAQ